MLNEECFDYNGQIVQQTKKGTVHGIRDQKTKTLAWLGVPYAKPPVGDLRWKAPRPVKAWEGILRTQTFQNKCVQKIGQDILGAEDCLYLNIWRPDSIEKRLPVMVWVHGGGNILGSAEDFKGDILAAKTNSIIISLNHRLGILGWFRLPALYTGNRVDDSGNYGLLDILQALQWVRQNISCFGGDHENITFAGHSAGARNVLAGIISPLSKGLFHKGLIVSGGRTLAKPTHGEEFAKKVVAELLMRDGLAKNKEDAEQLLNHPNEKISSYLKNKVPEDFQAFLGPVEIRMADFPHLFTDGVVIPTEGFEKFYQGDYMQVPIILGCDVTEYGIYNILDPYWQGKVLNLEIMHDPEKLALYMTTLQYGSKLFACGNADSTADILAGTQEQPVYVYRMAWGTQEGTLAEPLRILAGASHQVDLDFFTGYENYVLNTMYPGMCYSERNRPGRVELTACVMRCLQQFMLTGDPNHNDLPVWQPWQHKHGKAMCLDADANTVRPSVCNEYYDKEQVLAQMQKNLSQDEQQIILGNLLKGRFFMEY